MLRFRSSLLKALPKGPQRHDLAQVFLRTGILLALGIVLVALVAFTLDRTFGQRLPGRILYWFHDEVYLSLKGWLWTRFYPYSLILWGLLGLWLGAVLFRFLTGVPLLRGLHQRWTRWTLGQRALHPLLLAGARRLHRFGVEPVFLRRVLRQEHHRLLQPWPSADAAGRARQLARLLKLQEGLNDKPAADGFHRFEHLCLWQQALRIMQHRGRDAERPARQQLLDRSEALVAGWLPSYESSGGEITPTSLAVDLWLLRSLDGAVSEDEVGVDDVKATLLMRLQDRLRQLANWQVALHHGHRLARMPEPPSSQEESSALKSRGARPDQTMRLFLDVTLECASRFAYPDLAVEVLDRLDQLRFSLRAAGSRVRSAGHESLALMLTDLPRATDLQDIAVLQAQQLQLRRRVGEAAQLSEAGVMDEAIWNYEARQVEALRLAAGPGCEAGSESAQQRGGDS